MKVMYKKGRAGEERAAEALKAAGMEIIAKNYRYMSDSGIILGEIDIIAQDNETIVFTEVKSSSVMGAEGLQYTINDKKQRKIIKTAKYFLSENRKYSNMSIRFDVVFVRGCEPKTGDKASGYIISHLASAFMESV